MPDTPNRRAFLLGSAVVPIALAAQAQEKPPRDDLAQSAPPPDRPADPAYRPAWFTPAEWAFVNAACDRLIPRDAVGPGAVELGVPEYIDRQMQTPWAEGAGWYMSPPFIKVAPEFGYQSALTPRQQYRLAIAEIDAACARQFGKAFAALTAAQQDATLSAIEAGRMASAQLSLKGFFTGFLLKNTMEGYFGDPLYGGNKDMAAWRMIGYPGVRADYRDWVDRPARYPYGPVSLHGQG